MIFIAGSSFVINNRHFKVPLYILPNAFKRHTGNACCTFQETARHLKRQITVDEINQFYMSVSMRREQAIPIIFVCFEAERDMLSFMLRHPPKDNKLCQCVQCTCKIVFDVLHKIVVLHLSYHKYKVKLQTNR